MFAKPEPHMTVDEFWELVKAYPDGRYEFIRGEVRALHILNMAGGSNNHELISHNIGVALTNALRAQKSPCKVYPTNTYIYLNEEMGKEEFVFADVSVSCDANDRARKKGIKRPSLIVEVLSPRTTTDDRTWKKDDYLACLSLQEYMIVDATRRSVEVYHRMPDGSITYCIYEKTANIPLQLGFSLVVDDIYDDIIFA